MVINIENLKELQSIPFLKEILKLSQIWNTLGSAQRLLLMTKLNNNNLIKQRDNFYGLITISSYLFEGMKTADNILKRISPIIPNNKHKEVAWIHTEVRDKKSFYNGVIAKIRNNIGFHFSYSINDEHIKNVSQEFPIVFAQSMSDRRIDLVYLMADHLMAELPPFSNIPDNKKQKKIEDMIVKLRDYTIRFCNFLDEIITVSLKPYLEIRE